jgi:hypothetical protein
VVFNDVTSYEKYKKEVKDCGGTIVHDLGTLLMARPILHLLF